MVEEQYELSPLRDFPEYLPLKLAVLSRLKDAILDGTLKPGTLLSENKLASQLQVSRTPVREALGVLETEQLVTKLPGRKLIVSEPPAIEDMIEIYDIRLILESEALRRITPERSDIIERLENCVARSQKGVDTGDVELLMQMNAEFHSTLISALNNRRLKQFIDSIYDQISRFRLYSLSDEEWAAQGVKEHAELVQLLKTGKQDQAAEVMRRHLETALDLLKDKFFHGEQA
jgi:DNA-binding GntR family transcriptional regulator